jgi:hypothetical protein
LTRACFPLYPPSAPAHRAGARGTSRLEMSRWGGPKMTAIRSQGWRKPLWLVLGLSLLPGCGTFYDDLRARSPEPGLWNNITFRTKLAFNMFDPLEILASNEDGDMRRRAYLQLKEPKEGTKEHEMIVNVLRTASTQERDMVVRMAAIAKLGELKDSSATQILIEAYDAPTNRGEVNTPVRMAVVRSLGQRGDPAGMQIIAASMAKDQSMDLRLTAVDALAGFKEAQAAGTLVQVLREERDIGMRHRAHRSLQKMTGKNNIPPKAEEWEVAVRGSIKGTEVTKELNPTLMLANWWYNE